MVGQIRWFLRTNWMRRTVFLYLKRCICMLVTAEAPIQKQLYTSGRVQHISTLWGRGLGLDCPFSTKTLSMLWPSLDKSRDWGIKDRHTKRVCHTARGAYWAMITGNEIGKTWNDPILRGPSSRLASFARILNAPRPPLVCYFPE